MATLAGVSRAARSAQLHDDDLLLRLQQARLSLFESHLELEEKLAGDAIATASITAHLEVAAGALQELAEGAEPSPGPLFLRVALQRLAELRGATNQRLARFDGGQLAGPGSAGEASYDDRFEVLLGELDEAAEALARHREQHQEGARRVLAAAIWVWGAATVLAAFALWRWEVRRRAAEVALSESRLHLQRAQRMEAVGRLAGGIAHDINNSLAAIRAHCELVLRKELPRPKLEEKMRAVVDTVLRAAALVERLLTFAKRQPTRPERVDLNEVVEELDRVMQGTLPEGVELHLDLAPDLWPVEIDLAQLDQVLANLFVNARDALRGGGRLDIATRNEAVAGGPDMVRLSVADNGVGIPSGIQESIFDPFFTTKEAHGASGLGLATVWAIVQQARGRIEVDSAVGRGTTVHVLLPRGRYSLDPAGGAVGRASSAPRKGARILLVEDDSAVAPAVAAILDAQGYQVTVARDGAAAMAAVTSAASPFDLVVTDVRLPGISGPELVAQLRGLRPLKALFMSGFTDRIALREVPSPDDAFFLKKPFSAEGLCRMVKQLLGSMDGPDGQQG